MASGPSHPNEARHANLELIPIISFSFELLPTVEEILENKRTDPIFSSAMHTMDKTTFQNLVRQLAAHPRETEWLEWKHNNSNPQEIGENISGLSNAAALLYKQRAYILWGLEDESHQILGTTFRPREAKTGNQELESWLIMHLNPQIDFRFLEGDVDGKWIVLLEIPPAEIHPVSFKEVEHIRIGSYTKRLQEFPEKERQLWRLFDRSSFEKGIAGTSIPEELVLSFLDYPSYFQLMQLPLPENRVGILQRLTSEKVIIPSNDGGYDITNLGAILFAKNLKDFDHLSRKSLRVIFYRGDHRAETAREYKLDKGYAAGFQETIDYINNQLPHNEEIKGALREEVRMYPEIAIRELVANALIHQDFSIRGTGPMMEIFSNRIEISNPGLPLIDVLRFIDETARSRNEMLAAFMRRLKICEERGTGIDKVIFNIELFQLPAPNFRTTPHSTVAVLYGPRQLKQMDTEERKRACYQHACLQYVCDNKMTNESLRRRLGINRSSYPLASRIIRDTIQSKLIKPRGDAVGFGKSATYLPFWA